MRGSFRRMDATTQREIAAKGGRTAHAKGTAHQWTSAEARAAGRKGGMASHRRSTLRCLDCGSLRVVKERPPKPVPPERLVSIVSTLSCATPRSVYWYQLTGWAVDAVRGMPMFCCESEAEVKSMCSEHGFMYAGLITRTQRRRGER
jgi:general stress protein YciG